MHRVDAFGNLPGVCRKLAEGIGSLPGWRRGVRQKKTETHRKIIEGSRKACRERPEDLPQDCQRLLEYMGQWLDRPYHRIRATGSSFRWVNHPGGE
ncbi:hypothetical protein GW17_00040782 [Ensete ventricosum]|nr:hypothetical protein GW17_00040782 [Ensete ventricosum]